MWGKLTRNKLQIGREENVLLTPTLCSAGAAGLLFPATRPLDRPRRRRGARGGGECHGHQGSPGGGGRHRQARALPWCLRVGKLYKEAYVLLQNCEQKHRTEVFVMTVTEELPEWEDSRSIGRKRKWFTMEDALTQLSLHKPGQLTYLQSLLTCRNEKVT
ncbi:hypothetical protein FOCC_FOCC013071 [Frankliniella occidentalis]|nr:hypothetical protein FOCC_FOCC013071 [Frankliniella occidentalis]